VSRMLILDYALSPPVINEGIASYFVRTGCSVDYRQFYPNVVLSDMEAYDIVILLAGRTPVHPSGLMSIYELAPVSSFVRGGGTLILGPNLEGGEGANERVLFNKLLSNLGVGIRITNETVTDEVNGYASTLAEPPFLQPVAGHAVSKPAASRLAFDRLTHLVVDDTASVLLTTFETASCGEAAALAMSRVDQGIVIVGCRYLFNAMGVSLRISGEPLAQMEQLQATDAYLECLARYITGITDGNVAWSHANPLQPSEIGPARSADFDMNRAPVAEGLPDGIEVVTFDSPTATAETCDLEAAERFAELPDAELYGWIQDEGIRASWGSTVNWADSVKTEEDVKEIAEALEACNVNLFWGISNCQAVGGPGYSEEERQEVLKQWGWTDAALRDTGVKWYPTLDYRYFREEQSRCFGAQGQKLDAPSPMDMIFWRDNLGNSLKAIAEFSLDHTSIGGITIDVELYGHPPAYNYYTGYGFEDACYRFALDKWQGTVADVLLDEARDVQLPDRFDWLRSHAMLKAYFDLLSLEVERVCREIREEVWEINPKLLFASYIFTTPCNWFEMGIYRGFTTPERPMILMTFNVRSARMLEYLRDSGVYAYHASVALLGAIEEDEYTTVFSNALKYGHGYWMNNINSLLAAEPGSVEAPARKGISRDRAIEVIREASEFARENLR